MTLVGGDAPDLVPFVFGKPQRAVRSRRDPRRQAGSRQGALGNDPVGGDAPVLVPSCSVNHSAPSGPAVIPVGKMALARALVAVLVALRRSAPKRVRQRADVESEECPAGRSRWRLTGGPRKEEWFQVTHFPACSPTGAPGLNGGSQVSRPLPPSLATTTFRRLPVDAPEGVCKLGLIEADVSERPFSRPRRLPVLPGNHSGVKDPDLFLLRPAQPSTDPFGLWAPSPAPVCDRYG
jgi:hypothetical protein